MTRAAFALFAVVLMAGCKPASQAEIAKNTADPAIAGAMAEPIMTDTQMGEAASPGTLRPGDQPASVAVPPDLIVDTAGAPTLGAVAAARVREPAFAGCKAMIGYSAQWSLKLPAALALPKTARLSEGAGSDTPGCALRIIRFGMASPPATVAAGYEAIAKQEGFVTSRSGDTITATRARDGAAFQIEAVANADGSRVDLSSRTR
jgi:hypothetical protein